MELHSQATVTFRIASYLILIPKGLSGFVPVAARWVIERSNAWVERCKSLVKNFDRTLKRSNAKLKLCFIRLMLKRLAAA